MLAEDPSFGDIHFLEDRRSEGEIGEIVLEGETALTRILMQDELGEGRLTETVDTAPPADRFRGLAGGVPGCDQGLAVELNAAEGRVAEGPCPGKADAKAMVVDPAAVGERRTPLALDEAVIAKGDPFGLPGPVKGARVIAKVASHRADLVVGLKGTRFLDPEKLLTNSIVYRLSLQKALDAAASAAGTFFPEVEVGTAEGIHEPLVMPVVHWKGKGQAMAGGGTQRMEIGLERIIEDVDPGLTISRLKVGLLWG